MAVLKEWRYEIHVTVLRLYKPVDFYVIDRQTGIRHPLGKWPHDVLELMYSDFAAFNAQTVVVEDVDPTKGPQGIYGEWTCYRPPVSDFMKRHPFLRWLFQEQPFIQLRLNEVGEILASEEKMADAAAHQKWVAAVSSAT